MEFIDYYKILEIDKNASAADIKKAYRRLARKHHPDLNPNDKNAKTKFQKINEANEALSDPEKRKKYDQYGSNWKHGGEYEQPSGPRQGYRKPAEGFDSSGNFEERDFSDFFESLFGGAQRGRQSTQSKFRGQDYNAELSLDLRDAYETHKRTLTVNGKNIRITIPAGIENGQTIKIAGHGGEGANGGPNGDLYIAFSISNSTQFKREGDNLHKEQLLDLYSAVLGGEITIETFDGAVKLKVKPETQNGTKVKLKGKGFPVYKKEGEFGDLYITWQIKTPVHISEKEKALFRELQKISGHGK
ncbi:MAG: J domain-containing protein [Bacteroidetes bacterium]|nr:J domain-containing protein [Bacteroidota bacterium]